MNEKWLKVMQFLAGIIFISAFANYLSMMLTSSAITVNMILETAAALLFAVALFAKLFSLIEVGVVLQGISLLIGLIRNLSSVNAFFFANLVAIVGYIFIAVAVLQKKAAIKYCLLGSTFFMARQILLIVPYLRISESGGMLLQLNSQIRNAILVSIPFALTGIVLESMARGVPEKTECNTKITAIDDKIERLKKLKELMDAKAITQEEFDTKKKQLLDI